MEPRTHRFAVRNEAESKGTHELVFYDWGDIDAKQVIVCVHGLTRNAHDFDLLAMELASRGARVFALNMAGRGESAWLADPAGYNYGAYVADCLAVLDNFHLRSVDWIGTSMGGIIGMMVAHLHKGRIRKLVLNDIGTLLNKDAVARIFTYVRDMPKRFATRAEADTYLREIFAPFGIADPTLWERFVTSTLLSNNDGSVKLAVDPALIEPIRESTKNFTEIHDVNLSNFWEKQTLPTLILRGETSDVLSERTVNAMMAINPHAETVMIPNVGHAPSLMTPEQIAIVANWLIPRGLSGIAAGL